ncbi:MAG: hypothetical protein WC635_14290 [Bacteriovorax sp.]|jgi:hypothetical protein
MICLFCFWACSINDFDAFLKSNNVNLNFNGSFTVKSKSSTPLILLGENQSSKQLLKINVRQVKNYAEALAEVKKSIFLIVSQYEFTMAPYPGQITIASNCGLEFHPKLNIINEVYYITAYVNERLALSLCKSDGYSYSVSTAYFHDADKSQLLTVDFYQSKDVPQIASDNFFRINIKNVKNINLAEFSNLIK